MVIVCSRERSRGKTAMNDAKCKRGLRVPAASITLLHLLHLLQREVKCEFGTLAALCYPALLFCRPAFSGRHHYSRFKQRSGRNQPSLDVE